ncbi:MAG: tRNA lysidine(34) synthetase TilS [Limnobacter sp.]|nr:tRNA lysidine(34) synthetase TilS [Limnobacter sp.]
MQQAIEQSMSPAQSTPRVVAWSGGLDSTVLLHALVQSGCSVKAVHVNHGLQEAAQDFEQFCLNTASALGVDLTVFHLSAKPATGSIEAWARQARYETICDWMHSQGFTQLCLAHHLDDQLETTLLQLFRGSGFRGVGGMQAESPVGVKASQFPELRLYRPFLNLKKSDLLDYAKTHGLNWVQDPSNSEQTIRRNWLRLSVLPMLREQYPQVDQSIQQLQQFMQEHHISLDAMALDLLALVSHQNSLDLKAWGALAEPSRLEVLRLWLLNQGIRCGREKLLELNRQLLKLEGGTRQVAGDWAVKVNKAKATLHATPTK